MITELSANIINALSRKLQRPPSMAGKSAFEALLQFIGSLASTTEEKRIWDDFQIAPSDSYKKNSAVMFLLQKLNQNKTSEKKAAVLFRAFIKSNTDFTPRKFGAKTKGAAPLARRIKPAGTAGITRSVPRSFNNVRSGGGAAKKAVRKTIKPFRAIKKAAKKAAAKKGRTKTTTKSNLRRDKNGEQVFCMFQAQVAKEVMINQAAAVEVTVSRKKLAKIAGSMTGGKGESLVFTKKELKIRIRALAQCVVEGEDVKIVKVPDDKEEEKVYFTIRPKYIGQVSFQIEILQLQILICSIKLEPECIKIKPISSKPLIQKLHVSTQKNYPEKTIQLFIREVKMGGRVNYAFDFHAHSIGVFETFESEPIRGNRNAYIKKLYKGIENLGQTSAFDSDEFLNKLKDWGANLYTELIPIKLGEVLHKNADKIKSIQVISNEPFIPWELLLIKNPNKQGYSNKDLFFGEMGLVRWLFGWPSTQELRIRGGKRRYVIPHYENEEIVLPETKAEESYLIKTLDAKKLAPDPKKIRSLLQKKNSFDLLHFACHGQADSKNILNSSLILQEKKVRGSLLVTYLTQVTIEQSPAFTIPNGIRPIVVVNACEVGRRGFQLTQMGGFAKAFIDHGAGVFVGASWSIGDKAAREFVEEFYNSLLKGRTLSNAAVNARKLAKTKHPLDATWIAYLIYGDPFAKLEQN